MATDPKRQWLARVLGVVVPEAATAASDELAQAYAELLETVAPDLRALTAADAPAAAPIAALVERAKADAQAGRFEAAVAAVAALTEATDALAAAAKAGSAAAAKAAIPEGTVARMKERLAQSASRWARARDAAQSGAKSFQAELHTRYPAEAAGFQAILDSYWSDLNEAIAAGGQGDATAVGKVVETAQQLRGEMQSDALFAHLERNGIAVRPAFVAALDEVEELLAA